MPRSRRGAGPRGRAARASPAVCGALSQENRVQTEIAQERLADTEAALARAREQASEELIRSPTEGVFVVAGGEDLVGRHVQQGEVVAHVVDLAAATARVVVSPGGGGAAARAHRGRLGPSRPRPGHGAPGPHHPPGARGHRSPCPPALWERRGAGASPSIRWTRTACAPSSGSSSSSFPGAIPRLGGAGLRALRPRRRAPGAARLPGTPATLPGAPRCLARARLTPRRAARRLPGTPHDEPTGSTAAHNTCLAC